MKRPLFDHQEKALQEIKRRATQKPSPQRNHGILFEMRTGKTLLTIRWIVWASDEDFSLFPEKAAPHLNLVVAPKTVLESWERELSEEGEYYVVLTGLSPKKREQLIEEVFSGEHGDRVWVLVNYETVRVMREIVFLHWFSVILDESTYIKSSTSQISKLCTDGFRNVEHRAVLTGSPCPESLLDIFMQMKFLFGQFMGCKTYWDFRQKFFEIDPRSYTWKPKKGKAIEIKNEVHRLCFVLRRRDINMFNKKIREVRKIDMDKEQKKLYDQIYDDFEATFINPQNQNEEVSLSTDLAVVKTNWLSRVAGGSTPGKSLRDEKGKVLKVLSVPTFSWTGKAKELLSLLRGELSEELVIVYFHYNEEILGVSKFLRKAGIEHYTLFGEDDRDSRKRKMDGFRSGRVKVILCQVAIVKFGIDLSASSTIIWYSETYNGLDKLQADERIVHPTKTEPLLYIYLHSRETIDEDVHEAVSDKAEDNKMFMTNLRKIILARKGKK